MPADLPTELLLEIFELILLMTDSAGFECRSVLASVSRVCRHWEHVVQVILDIPSEARKLQLVCESPIERRCVGSLPRAHRFSRTIPTPPLPPRDSWNFGGLRIGLYFLRSLHLSAPSLGNGPQFAPQTLTSGKDYGWERSGWPSANIIYPPIQSDIDQQQRCVDSSCATSLTDLWPK